MKDHRKKILIEIPTIVISVMIALSINEWNNQRERDLLAANVIQAINDELKLNTAEVKRAYEYHLPLVTNLSNGNHRMFGLPLSRLKLTKIDSEHLQTRMTELLDQLGEVVEQPLVVKRRNDTLYSMLFKKQWLTLKIFHDSLHMYGRGNISLRSASIRNDAWQIAQTAQIAPYLDFRLIRHMSEINRLHLEYNNTVNLIIEMLYKGESDGTSAMQDMLHTEGILLKKYRELGELLEIDDLPL